MLSLKSVPLIYRIQYLLESETTQKERRGKNINRDEIKTKPQRPH